MVPLLALGIPGSGATAVMLGALMLFLLPVNFKEARVHADVEGRA